MRRRLKESRAELDTRKHIQTLYWWIEYILWFLRNMNSSSASSDSSTSGGSLTLVATLPVINTGGEPRKREVLWGDATKITGGTGDNGIWWCIEGADVESARWYPMVYTTKSGVVV